MRAKDGALPELVQIYEYRGHRYEVTGVSQMKCPDREWVPAVIYKNESGESFVRAAEEFMTRFKPIESKVRKWTWTKW